MVFKCQEDSFLKQYSSVVIKCEPTTEPVVEYGKTSPFEGYQVTLEDTILFPAGGGQIMGRKKGPHYECITKKKRRNVGLARIRQILAERNSNQIAKVSFQERNKEDNDSNLDNTSQNSMVPNFEEVQSDMPHDVGRLNKTEVVQVLRKGDEALHFTKEPIAVGTVVEQEIDWDRRFDHMQQHSGQHVLSAILEKEHNLPTTSWWLGSDESYVELDAVKISDEVINATEKRCNDLIMEAVPVNVKICKATDPDLDEAHTRGLPKDCMEKIRIICIGTIDENMCCGTHVTNLSQLQMIKLIGLEPGKKGKSILKFLVGHRVTKTFQLMTDRERALTGLLKNEPSRHEELIQKLQKNLKVANKNLQNVLQELAQYEADKIKSASPKPKYVIIFKKEATPEFNRAVIKGLEGEDLFLFLASEDPDKPKEGQIIIQGPEEHCNALGDKLTELVKGKGAFKNGKFQGKAGDLSGMAKCKKLIEEYFNGLINK